MKINTSFWGKAFFAAYIILNSFSLVYGSDSSNLITISYALAASGLILQLLSMLPGKFSCSTALFQYSFLINAVCIMNIIFYSAFDLICVISGSISILMLSVNCVLKNSYKAFSMACSLAGVLFYFTAALCGVKTGYFWLFALLGIGFIIVSHIRPLFVIKSN